MTDAPLHILLVDDDDVDRTSVRRALRASATPVDITDAPTAAAVLAAARSRSFDCILLDYLLPDADGLSLLRDLRAAGLTTPVILLTGQGDEQIAVQAMKAGASDYLVKSRVAAGDTLARAVQSAVRLHRAEQSAAAAAARVSESEQRFRAMADSAPVLLWVSDPGGHRSYFNQAWLTFRGQTTVDEAGHAWLAGVHPDDRDAVAAVYAGAERAGVPVEIEYRLRRSDGAYRWVFERATPRYLPDGSTTGYIGSCIDVTDRREAEAKLRETNDTLTAVIQASPLPIYAVTPDGSVTLWNPAAERAFGWTAGEVLGKYLPLSPRGPSDSFDRICGRALAGDPVAGVEVVRHRKDGSAVDLSVSAAPLRDAAGRITGALVMADDITMRKAVEMERARLLLRERRARADADAARRRLTFLAEASTALSASLDYETTLNAMARVCVPAMGDWCAVHMLEPDGTLRQIAVAHTDPGKIQLALELARKYPVSPDDPTGIAPVLRTGQSQLYPEISDDLLRAMARDDDHFRVMRTLGMRSAMIVPLAARGRTFGTILFVAAESDRKYTPADLALVEDLARRAAIAVDNAALYRQAQRALKESDESAALLDTLFTSAPTGLAFFDTDFRFQRINASLAAINGLPPEAHLGKRVADVIPDVWPTVRRYMEAVLATGQPVVDVEAAGSTPAQPGVARHWLTSWYPVRTAAGQLLGVGVVTTEITERKRYEEELKEAKESAEAAKESAEAANAAKDQFLAVLSHELRTPLTPVLVAAQSMEEDRSTPPDLRPTVEMIRRNVDLEARLIDDLLDLTRISKGKLELSLEDTDAHAALRNALDICRTDVESKHITLTADLAATHHWVRADPARLQQIFWNLIKNAVKFTPNGGRLSVSTSSLNPEPQTLNPLLSVQVTDTGIGIDPDVLPRIFDAFEQGEKSVTRKFGGLGLGLAITKALIDMHKGRIAAHSEGKNHGATFTVTLPTIAAPLATPLRVPATPLDAGSNVRILMVDDHEDTGRAMKTLLERRGYTVRLANSVSTALAEAARDDDFDLLISDIGLPDGTGIDLIRALRSRHHRPGPLKGIALSGFGMEDDVRRSKEAGFAEHLTKPVDLKRLQAVIRQLTTR